MWRSYFRRYHLKIMEIQVARGNVISIRYKALLWNLSIFTQRWFLYCIFIKAQTISRIFGLIFVCFVAE